MALSRLKLAPLCFEQGERDVADAHSRQFAMLVQQFHLEDHAGFREIYQATVKYLESANIPARPASSPGNFSGYRPHPNSDANRAAQLNLEYQAALAQWQALSWWKRLTTPRPQRPTGI